MMPPGKLSSGWRAAMSREVDALRFADHSGQVTRHIAEQYMLRIEE